VNVNAALFYTDVEDMQFFNFFAGPFGLLRVVTTLDEVSIQGAEFDFRWKAGDVLSLFGGYAFIDGEIDRYDGRPYTESNEVPYAPEYTGNLGAELTFPIGDLELMTRLDASFVGETWFHPVQGERLPNLFTAFNFGQGEFSKQKRDPYYRAQPARDACRGSLGCNRLGTQRRRRGIPRGDHPGAGVRWVLHPQTRRAIRTGSRPVNFRF
jgi:iron complex outermembrane receptor protein